MNTAAACCWSTIAVSSPKNAAPSRPSNVAATVVATNGAIGTLLFTLGDVTVDLSTLAGQVVVALYFGAILFLAISAGCGLLANRPARYGVTNPDELAALAANDAVWTASLDKAQKNVAADIARIVKIAEKRNDAKGRRLRWAVDTQVIGLALLAATLLVDVVLVLPPS